MHSQVGVSACQFPNPSVPSERPLQCCVVLLFHPGVSSCTPAVPVLLVLGNFAGRRVDPSLIPPARAPEDLVPGNTLSNMPVIHITGCIFSYTFLVCDRAGGVGCSSAQHKVKPPAGLGGLPCLTALSWDFCQCFAASAFSWLFHELFGEREKCWTLCVAARVGRGSVGEWGPGTPIASSPALAAYRPQEL